MVVLKKAQWTEETQPKARTPRSDETPSAGWFCHLAIMVCLWLFKAVFLDKTGAHSPPQQTPQGLSPQSTLQNLVKEGEEKPSQLSISSPSFS